jgi:hypothetical protein
VEAFLPEDATSVVDALPPVDALPAKGTVLAVEALPPPEAVAAVDSVEEARVVEVLVAPAVDCDAAVVTGDKPLTMNTSSSGRA